MPEENGPVLVTGATGRQGGSVARHLLHAGHLVRTLTRSPHGPASDRLREAGAEVVGGDLNDGSSLHHALRGVRAVFSVQDFWAPGVGYDGEIRQGRNLARAARAAGVVHYVQSTMASATDERDLPRHFASKRVVEGEIDALGLPCTLIGTVFFMDNFAERRGGGRLLFPTLAGALRPDTRIHLLASTDVGPAAVRVLAEPGRFLSRRVDLAGDLLTVEDMKQEYRAVTGRSPRRWRIPAWLTRRFTNEFADQLHWHNHARFLIDPDPALTSFATYLRERALINL